MKKIAVVLSGCGHKDGTEIREAVITLLEIERAGAKYFCFAPNIKQRDVINHLTGEICFNEFRNVLVESARIARGDIKPLEELKVEDFDAIILPGGYGAAKNLSDIALGRQNVISDLSDLIKAFIKNKKPIGAICIAPAVVAVACGEISPEVTIGDDNDGLIAKLGGKHKFCKTNDIIVDSANKIVTAPAYMREDSLVEIAEGISKLVKKVVALS